MKNIIVAHNYYQQAGGEDRVFEAEIALLESHGHTVTRFTMHNDIIDSMPKLLVAGATIWNHNAAKQLDRLINQTEPDLIHFHNTFPLISPAAYYTAHARGVPVIQTLHNYRLLCPNALLFRDRSVCEECLDKRIKWPAIKHRCYRGSIPGSATVASMIAFHHLLGTWRRKVDTFIALTDFSREKFMAGGIDSEKIFVKPNFCANPDVGPNAPPRRNNALFVGRLSVEKGIELLADAWNGSDVPLKIIGDGPLRHKITEWPSSSLEYLGAQDHATVLQEMRRSGFLVFPSECYENMSVAMLEAMASGLPIIAANTGANPELVQDGKTGFLFRPHDSQDLRAKVQWAADNPNALRQMGIAARAVYEKKYNSDQNYRLLSDIYQQTIRCCGRPQFNSGIAGATPADS